MGWDRCGGQFEEGPHLAFKGLIGRMTVDRSVLERKCLKELVNSMVNSRNTTHNHIYTWHVRTMISFSIQVFQFYIVPKGRATRRIVSQPARPITRRIHRLPGVSRIGKKLAAAAVALWWTGRVTRID